MSCRPLDLFPLISASYGDGGMCPANGSEFSESQQQELLLALNQMLPMLMKRLDSKGTLARWDVPVDGGIFALPMDCVDVRQAFLNGHALTLRDQWFEGRIGHTLYNCDLWCGSSDLIDVGDGFSLPERWPHEMQDTRYGVYAEHDDDAGKTVQVRYKDRYGHEQEETLELQPNQLVTATEGVVIDVTYQNKGTTKGAVVGMVVYAGSRPERIVRIPAKVASPSFHKKKLPMSFGRCNGELCIIGKLRFTELSSVTDILPICDPMALSFGLQALHALKNKRYDDYNSALTLSVNELVKEMGDVQPAGAVTQMNVKSPVRFRNRCFS